MASRQETAKILATLAATYPSFNLTEDTVVVYQRLLSDLDAALLDAATVQCATHCTFFPSVAEVRAAAMELLDMAEQVPAAVDAWGEVRAQMSAVGQRGKPTWSHPLVGQIASALGWKALCMSEHQTADRARYIDAYEDARATRRRKQQMLPEVREFVEGNLRLLLEKAKA